jgi:predicted unusual protein kinase regulating ubiquinone biosynthesis (AarF/ABC1/UbiB family)
MEYLKGKKLIDYKNAPQKIRNDLAKKLFITWYYPFYKYGIIHGDPHLGNYSVDQKNNINLFDYGCVRIFPPKFVKGVIDLYFALKNKDQKKIKAAYVAWGFNNIDEKLMSSLNKWALFLYDPILHNGVRKIQESDSGIYGAKIAGEVHQELKKYGGVKPPREFVFMDRAAVGLGSIFIHLKAEVNWYKIFHDLIKDFDVKKVTQNQKKALKS